MIRSYWFSSKQLAASPQQKGSFIMVGGQQKQFTFTTDTPTNGTEWDDAILLGPADDSLETRQTNRHAWGHHAGIQRRRNIKAAT